MQPSRDIARLIEIMAALRTPGTGCPWDLEQDFSTIAPYTVEEAYEVADAIARNDMGDLTEELGDLLLQVAFHARLGEEAGAFDFGDVVQAITAKLVRRHPHVFGDVSDLSPDEVKNLWGRIKAQEKAERAERRAQAGLAPDSEGRILDGIPLPLPALTRALKLQEKAGKVGFDWHDARQVLAKIREEVDEVGEALDTGGTEAIRDEVGDLLFAVVNLARHAGVDPEAALDGTNRKFTRRFAFIEDNLAGQGRHPAGASLDEMEALWVEAKRRERETPTPTSPAPAAPQSGSTS